MTHKKLSEENLLQELKEQLGAEPEPDDSIKEFRTFFTRVEGYNDWHYKFFEPTLEKPNWK